jgi:DHA2 family multidrug resistance protein
MAATPEAAAGTYAGHRGWSPGHNPWAIAMTVTLATFMEILDTSIANVALPQIAGGLSASFDESTWILTSYLVSNAIVLPMSGWLAGFFGRKRFYMACVVVFTVSSLMCGLASSLGWLVFFRVLQGAGGGGLQPSEQSILADTFPAEKFGMAFAVYGMAVVLAPAIGPTLGGYITDHFNWRWVFFINIPIGVISLFLTEEMVEDPPWAAAGSRAANWRPDYIGLGLIALGFGCLQVVLDKGQREDWFDSHLIVYLALISAVALTGFVIWEWRQEHPVLDVKLFGDRTFAMANLMMFMLGIGLFGTTVLLPEYMQVLMGYSAETSGMVLSPGGFLIIAMMPMVGAMSTRVDGRVTIAAGFAVSALALFEMSNINLTIDFHTAMMYRVYQSAGLALLFVPITTMAYVGVPPEKNNTVSAMVNLARNIGASVGISMVTTVIARRTQFHQSRLADRLTIFDPAFNHAARQFAGYLSSRGGSGNGRAMIYAQLVRQSSAMAFVDAIWLLALGCVVMIPLVLLMRRSDPSAAPIGMH